MAFFIFSLRYNLTTQTFAFTEKCFYFTFSKLRLMKYIYSLVLAFTAYTASAQLYLHAGYSYSSPQQDMARNINGLHSIGTEIMYRFPGKLSRLQAGIDMGWG